MKKIITFMVAAAMCFTLAACEHHEPLGVNKDNDKIVIRITNDGMPVSGFGLTYYLGDSEVGSIGMQGVTDGNVSDSDVEFVLLEEDFPENSNLDNFGFRFLVTEETGVELSVCTMYFPVRFGNTYSFKLVNEDDCYAVWSELDGKTYSGPQTNNGEDNNAEQENELQGLNLVGPWHLDKEKNDFQAIEDAWESIPGYGEWGAGMEIRSNGFMSWYIGAVGGSGTYSIENNVMHTALFTEENGEKVEMSLDFLIVEDDELKMSYGDMEITWAYGDQEDTSQMVNKIRNEYL